MGNSKRYYWLKLMKDFFQTARIKKMRKIAGGDTYVIIYLKMMLLSINSEAIIEYEEVENTFADEIALILDEDIENVKVVIAFLIANNLMTQIDEHNYRLNEVEYLIGSETDSAQRVRKHRDEKRALQCNKYEINSNTDIDEELEIELDVDRQIEIENNKEKELKEENNRKEFFDFKNEFIKLHSGKFKFKVPYPNPMSLSFIEGTVLQLKENGYLHNTTIKKDLNKEQAFNVWDYLYANRDYLLTQLSEK
ncbi:MAG: hypothetical protein C0626_00660 [Arcobacter sp.]|uniref:phage replisome organizer N-terminal domain-containing protein n=1 Tax=uncultured Arcobacter sp. TaxID=165434 RepID=UPI000CA8653C|nr:phage replisome organizer N-terminal domain-containing protein [uncultured Arcobacter sp.]PLY11113.1 MAG: hypothetical protein C0626_00660 [Arcobacter sp.]